MSELQNRLKQMALDIYHESDKCETKNDATYTRRMLLEKIPRQERWMVKEYVRKIGRERQRKQAQKNYRNDIATAIDKGRLT